MSESDAPKKKRRTLRDAEQELEASRLTLADVKRKLILTVCPVGLICLLSIVYRERAVCIWMGSGAGERQDESAPDEVH